MKELFLHAMTDNIEQIVPMAAQRGLGVELTSFIEIPLLKNADELVGRYRRGLSGFTGTLSVHGPFLHLIPGAVDPLIAEATATRMRQAVAYAHEFGAKNLILHHGYFDGARFDQGWLKRSLIFWRNILAVLPEGLTIHLENVHELTPELQLALIDEIADQRLGICLDIGHAHAYSSVPTVDWVTSLGKRISYVHLHDNDGCGDQHLPLGQGNIPLQEVLSALEAQAPQAVWMIETEATASLEWMRVNPI